jgi:hypothetical protein
VRRFQKWVLVSAVFPPRHSARPFHHTRPPIERPLPPHSPITQAPVAFPPTLRATSFARSPAPSSLLLSSSRRCSRARAPFQARHCLFVIPPSQQGRSFCQSARIHRVSGVHRQALPIRAPLGRFWVGLMAEIPARKNFKNTKTSKTRPSAAHARLIALLPFLA